MGQKSQINLMKKNQLKNISALHILKQGDFDITESHSSEHPIIAKIVNFILKNGKKTKAEQIMQRVCAVLGTKGEAPPYEIIKSAVQNVKPIFELRKARISGSTQFIPATLQMHKQENVAIRWIVQAATEKKRKQTLMKNRTYGFEFFLAQELLDAYKFQGSAKQKRDEIHKLAEANRTLAFQRWW